MNKSLKFRHASCVLGNATVWSVIAFAFTPSVLWAGDHGATRGVSCPGSGSCFEPNGTPACDDATCCETICGIDPYCCNNEWDGQCAAAADMLCNGAPCAGADGDMNDDGSVNGIDVQTLISATIGVPTADEVCRGDFSTNGSLGIEDVPGMVAALLAP